MIDFIIPQGVSIAKQDGSFATFTFSPLEPGYGTTIGNALRRVLLSSMSGYAVQAIKITGVNNEFGAIAGIKEDVMDIIMNIKQIRITPQNNGAESEQISISLSKNVVDCNYINDQLKHFRIVNNDHIICNSRDSVNAILTLYIGYGRGYEESTKHKQAWGDDVIPVDSIYSPVRNVCFSVSNTRVDDRVDYEVLSLDITTDGTCSPVDIVVNAAEILNTHIKLFMDLANTSKNNTDDDIWHLDVDRFKMKKLLSANIDSIGLPPRAYNCLKRAGIVTVKDLVSQNDKSLDNVKNLGRKTLKDINTFLKKENLKLGMDLSEVI